MDISTITDAFGDVVLQQPTTGVIIAAILAAVLLLMSAFASGSEIAFFSLSPSDVAELEDGKFGADKKFRIFVMILSVHWQQFLLQIILSMLQLSCS